jgi:hypothetical protein
VKNKNQEHQKNLKKTVILNQKQLSQSESFLKQWKKVRYWSQDESRMGLHTIQRRKLTGYGIKPQGKVQWDFTYLWLYGAVEPLTGASFFYEFTHLDTVCFEKFLELFASEYPEDLHIAFLRKMRYRVTDTHS